MNGSDKAASGGKFGLIGGVGPLTTAPYYLKITAGVSQRCGGYHFPRLTIESLSAFDVIGMSGRGEWDRLTGYLLDGIRALARAGATECAMACVTGHTVYERLAEKSPIPLLHILGPVAEAARAKGVRRIGILGTAATMRCQGFRDYFASAGIDAVSPAGEEAEAVARIIELELGLVRDESVERIERIARRLAQDSGADALLLGCTELPLVFSRITPPVPAIDPVPLHIEAIIGRIMAMGGC